MNYPNIMCTFNKRKWFYTRNAMQFTWWHHTIIPQISVRLSFCVSRFAWKPFAQFASNSANVLLRTRRCAVWIEFVRMRWNYKIKRLRVVFAMPSPLPMLLSAILPMVAHSIALLAGDTGRSYTTDFLRNGEQSADNSDFTVCIIHCVYRAELILGR